MKKKKEMEEMTYYDVMGYESTSRCPKCGSYNCVDFDTPYFTECLECGFESMASDDPGKAREAWAHGYAEIEDKAKDVGIDALDPGELLDLWWSWVGMEGSCDMGMQPEDVDWYWTSHPDELYQTMVEMGKHFGCPVRG